jgi:hypothetical protein
MQTGKLGFDDLCETPTVFGIDSLLRPGGGSHCGVLWSHPYPDEFAELFAIAKPEGITFAKGLANGGVAVG